MSESGWYIDPEAGPVAAEDDDNYDEAYGPRDGATRDGRLVDEDEGVRADTTSEMVAHVAVGDTSWKSAEESAIHVVNEQELDAESLVDLDELPANPDERD